MKACITSGNPITGTKHCITVVNHWCNLYYLILCEMRLLLGMMVMRVMRSTMMIATRKKGKENQHLRVCRSQLLLLMMMNHGISKHPKQPVHQPPTIGPA